MNSKNNDSLQPKKINLAEAMKQKLAGKKNNNQTNQKYTSPGSIETKKLQSQQSKKVSSLRTKIGS